MTTEPHAHRSDRSEAEADTEPPSDALGHFWKAAHEMLLAARVVIDAADALVEEQMQSRPGSPAPAGSSSHARVRRIHVDER